MPALMKTQLEKTASTAIVALFLFSSLLTVQMAPGYYLPAAGDITGTSPPAHGDWIISDDTVVTNETIVLDGNLTIESGGSLELINSTLKMNVSFDGEYRIEVKNGGSLVVRDYDGDPATWTDASVITDGDFDDDSAPYGDDDDNNARYRFWVRQTAALRIENSEVSEGGYSWSSNGGLWMQNNNIVIIENSYFHHNYRGISFYGGSDYSLPGNRFEHNNVDIFVYNYSNFTVTGADMKNSGIGIYYHTVSDSFIRDCTSEGHTSYGFYAYLSGNIEITGCSVAQCGATGFYTHTSNHITIQDSSADDCVYYGFYSYNGDNITFSGNTAEHCNIGLYFHTVRDGLMEENEGRYNDRGNKRGMNAYGIKHTLIRSNVFSGNGAQGVLIYDSDNVTLQENLIENNPTGIYYYRQCVDFLTLDNILNDNGNGIYLHQRSTNNVFRGDTITGGSYGFFARDGSDGNILENLSISGTDNFDIYMRYDVNNEAWNTDYDTVEVLLGARFVEKNYISLEVKDLRDDPIEGVDIHVVSEPYSLIQEGAGDGTGEIVEYATPLYGGTDTGTGADGTLNYIPVTHRIYEDTRNNPRVYRASMNVSYHGWEESRTGLDMSSSRSEAFVKDIVTVDDSGGKDFVSIQDAVDYTTVESDIMVFPGTYEEDLIMTKGPLHIHPATAGDFDGVGAALPVLDAGGGVGLDVNVPGGQSLHFNGLVIRNASTGIYDRSGAASGNVYENISMADTQVNVHLGENTSAVLVNSLMNTSRLIFDNADASLETRSVVRFHITDFLENPLEGVIVNYTSAGDEFSGSLETGRGGRTPLVPLSHRFLNSSGEVEYFPYEITLYQNGNANSSSMEFPGSGEREMVLPDAMRFGTAVSVGDFNGDGYPDQAVGAPYADVLGDDGRPIVDAGKVYLYLGSRGSATATFQPDRWDTVIEGTRAGGNFGAALAMDGDINDDGLDDLVVGAPNEKLDLAAPGILREAFLGDQDWKNFASVVYTVVEDDVNPYQQGGGGGNRWTNYAWRYTGYLKVAAADQYTFYYNIDDGGRLFIDGMNLIDAWYDQGETEHTSEPVYLAEGYHPIEVQYYQGGGGQECELRWSSPAIPKQMIPSSVFFYDLMEARLGRAYVFTGRSAPADRLPAEEADQTIMDPDLDGPQSWLPEFGRRTAYAGDIDGDGCDEFVIDREMDDGSSPESILLYQGTSTVKEMDFSVPVEGFFHQDEWEGPMVSPGAEIRQLENGVKFISSGGTDGQNKYAYFTTRQPFSGELDVHVEFSRISGYRGVLSIFDYRVPESDVGDYTKQKRHKILEVRGDGDLYYWPVKGENSEVIENTLSGGDGTRSSIHVVVENTSIAHMLKVYSNGELKLHTALSGWESSPLYLTVGDSDHYGNKDCTFYSIKFRQPGTDIRSVVAGFGNAASTAGDLNGDGYDDMIVAGTGEAAVIFFGNESGVKRHRIIHNAESHTFDGMLDHTAIREAGVISLGSDGRSSEIVSNGHFDSGTDGWEWLDCTFPDQNQGTGRNAKRLRVVDDGNAVGDWWAINGPTGSFGSNYDTIASSGRDHENLKPCDGRFVSEAFEIMPRNTIISFKYHFKAGSFERTGSGWQEFAGDQVKYEIWELNGDEIDRDDELVETLVHMDGSDGVYEEDGEVFFDASAYVGRKLYVSVQINSNTGQNDNALAQIDDLVSKSTFHLSGNYTSPAEAVSSDFTHVYGIWEQQDNGGGIELRVRTTSDTSWDDAPVLENGGMVELAGTGNEFQYRIHITTPDNFSSPRISNLEFDFFAPGDQPPVLVSSPGNPVIIPAAAGDTNNDGFDDIALGQPAVNGMGAVYIIRGWNTTEQLRLGIDLPGDANITLTGPDGDTGFGSALSSFGDVNGDGFQDLGVGAPQEHIPEAGADAGRIYFFYLSGAEGERGADDADKTFNGTGSGENFGHAISGQLAGAPGYFPTGGYAKQLPRFFKDAAITGVSPEDGTLIYPGTVMNLKVDLINAGMETLGDVTVHFSIRNETGTVDEFEKTVNGGASGQVSFVNAAWEVPGYENMPYTIDISISAAGDVNPLNDHISVGYGSRYHRIELHPVRTVRGAMPGITSYFTVDIVNNGTLGPDDVVLTALVPGDWEYSYALSPAGGNITGLTVGDVETVYLRFTPPGDAEMSNDLGHNITAAVKNEINVTTMLDLTAYVVGWDAVPVSLQFFRADGKEAVSGTHLVGREYSLVKLAVKNGGIHEMGPFDIRLYRDVDGKEEMFHCEGLAPGETRYFQKEWRFDEGFSNLSVEVDTGDDWHEFNEENNLLARQTYVLPKEPDRPFTLHIKTEDRDGEALPGLTVEVDNPDSPFNDEGETGQDGTVDVVVDDYDEGDEIFIQVTSGDNYGAARVRIYSEDEFADVVIVVGIYSVELAAEKSFEEILPASHPDYVPARFPMSITNTGDVNDTYLLSTTGLPFHWDWSFQGGGVSWDGKEYTIWVPAGESRQVELLVHSSQKYSQTLAGNYPFTAQAVSLLSPHSVSGPDLEIAVPRTGNLVLGYSSPQNLSVEKGTTYDLVFYVDNQGNSELEIDLFLGGPDASWGRFKNGEPHLGITREPAGALNANVSTTLYVDVPRDVPTYHVATLWVYGMDAVSGRTEPLYFNITVISGTPITISETGEHHDNDLFASRITLKNEGEKHFYGNISEVYFTGGDAWTDATSIALGLNETISFTMWMRLTDMGPFAGGHSRAAHIVIDVDGYDEDLVFYPEIPRVSDVAIRTGAGEETVKEAFPGHNETFTFEIANYGNAWEILTFYFTGENEGWFLPPAPVQLDRNGMAELLVRCEVPGYASGTEEANVSLFARSDSGMLYGPLNFTLKVRESSRELEFSIPPKLDSTGIDGTVWVLRINNRGQAPETVILDARAPAGWNVSLELYRVSVEAGGYTRIPVKVVMEEGAENGVLEINATSAFSGDVGDSIELELPPILSVGLPPGPYMTLDEINFEVSSPGTSVFTWRVGNGDAAHAKNMSYVFERPGDYDILVVGTRSTPEGSLEGFVRFTVHVENRPPGISSLRDESGYTGKYYSLDGSQVASDPDGEIVSYRWLVILDEVAVELTGQKPYHLFEDPGNYTIVLNVTDDSGAHAEASYRFLILEEDVEPRKQTGDEDGKDMMTISLAGIIGVIIALTGLNLLLAARRGRAGSHEEKPRETTPPPKSDAHAPGQRPVEPSGGAGTAPDGKPSGRKMSVGTVPDGKAGTFRIPPGEVRK